MQYALHKLEWKGHEIQLQIFKIQYMYIAM